MTFLDTGIMVGAVLKLHPEHMGCLAALEESVRPFTNAHAPAETFATVEALNNVAIRMRASAVEVQINKLPDWICLAITGDGKSFDVKRVFRTKGNGRLGLLGIRERLQMVGGKFSIKSEAGHVTTLTARIPVTSAGAEKDGNRSSATSRKTK